MDGKRYCHNLCAQRTPVWEWLANLIKSIEAESQPLRAENTRVGLKVRPLKKLITSQPLRAENTRVGMFNNINRGGIS